MEHFNEEVIFAQSQDNPWQRDPELTLRVASTSRSLSR